ncbi:MAG: formylglycine-generating enzyme family protein, partial [Chitinophagales bacterium]
KKRRVAALKEKARLGKLQKEKEVEKQRKAEVESQEKIVAEKFETFKKETISEIVRKGNLLKTRESRVTANSDREFKYYSVFLLLIVFLTSLFFIFPYFTGMSEEEKATHIQKLIDDMVSVKGGTFRMGCIPERDGDCNEDETPAHEVTLSDFKIGKFEVTQGQWEAIMGENPSYFKNCSNCPVEEVSWHDAQDFIRKLNQQIGKTFRLPTEAEWEFAARGGTKSGNYKYAGSNSIDEVAWYGGNSGKKTHLVAGKKANELGLYDMSGNVWEWCEDDGHDNYNGAPTNGKAWIDSPRTASRVLRGGSWYDFNSYCRSTFRDYVTPTYRYGGNGMRLAQ